LYFKKASKNIEPSITAILKNKELFFGLAIYGASTVVYVIGIKGGELSVLFPLVSTGYIWICFLSIKFLDESMNRLKWMGIASIVVGVILIGLGSA